jgi:hypothetical protein
MRSWSEARRDADGVAQTEADHFGKCPVCGALVGMRDLAQVMAHAHGQEIEELTRRHPIRRKSGPARGLSITLQKVVVPELTRNASIQLTKRFSLRS